MDWIIFVTAAALSFAVTYLLGFIVIPYMHKLKFGQTILDIGPKWHKNKQGTATMGGLMFVCGVTLAVIAAIVFSITLDSMTVVACLKSEQRIIPLIAGFGLALGMGFIGFMDDYIKVVKKRNLGLTAKQKTILQLLIAAAYLYTMYLGGMTYTHIPFIGIVDISTGIGLLFWPIALVFIYGFTNAVNITDGIDGLASSVTAVVAAFFAILSLLNDNYVLSSITSIAFFFGCIGFLLWNRHPAKVFMGDTGSMFLGGMVVAISFMLEMPIILLFAGIVYFGEALSVVIQVTYYKRTKKRIFKMSPIHHHFEMSGWSENKIVYVFSLVAVIGCLIATALYLFT